MPGRGHGWASGKAAGYGCNDGDIIEIPVSDMPESGAFDTLKEEILRCRICEAQFGFAPRPVVVGAANARIMQVSQAPSRIVHATGKPFDDASGRRLRGEWYAILDAVFYDPDCFYIAAMAHCYPGKAEKGGDKPPPKICAQTWLAREMKAVDNRIYILIGAYAARYFYPQADFTALVAQDQTLGGKPAYVLPHPSPLNGKWLRDNPWFLRERMPVIRAAVHRVLGMAMQPRQDDPGISMER